ncbi:MAG: hypothetical protein ABFR63_07950, partial [Thermodesulfobacteriota bacterium]
MTYKQYIAACGIAVLSFASTSALATTDSTSPANKLQWQVEKNWQLPAKPLDLVYSLDGKRVFILNN